MFLNTQKILFSFYQFFFAFSKQKRSVDNRKPAYFLFRPKVITESDLFGYQSEVKFRELNL